MGVPMRVREFEDEFFAEGRADLDCGRVEEGCWDDGWDGAAVEETSSALFGEVGVEHATLRGIGGLWVCMRVDKRGLTGVDTVSLCDVIEFVLPGGGRN